MGCVCYKVISNWYRETTGISELENTEMSFATICAASPSLSEFRICCCKDHAHSVCWSTIGALWIGKNTERGTPMRLLDQVREVIRKKHYSIRTEQAYVQYRADSFFLTLVECRTWNRISDWWLCPNTYCRTDISNSERKILKQKWSPRKQRPEQCLAQVRRCLLDCSQLTGGQ